MSEAPSTGEQASTALSASPGALDPPTQLPTPASVRPSATLAWVDVLDRDGRVRQSLRVVAWPLRIGRAIDNDVVLDDAHVAPHHAVIDAGLPSAAVDGPPASVTLCLRVLPGKNGMRWGRRALPAGGDAITLDDLAEAGSAGAAELRGPIELVAGQTRLRLRRAGDTLEPERLLPISGAAGHTGTLVLAVLLWLWVLAEHAIGLDPGSKASEWLPPLVGAPLAVAGWCVLWGLASKIFQHRFEFWGHVSVAVRGLLALEVAGFVLMWLSGLTGWPGFSRLIMGAGAAIAVATLWGHASLVLPQQRRPLGYAAATAYVVGAAILLALNLQRNERWFGQLYSHALPPPALMWRTPTSREAFVKRAERLRPALEKSTAEAAADRKDQGDESEEE